MNSNHFDVSLRENDETEYSSDEEIQSRAVEDEETMNYGNRPVKGTSQCNINLDKCKEVRVGDVIVNINATPTRELFDSINHIISPANSRNFRRSPLENRERAFEEDPVGDQRTSEQISENIQPDPKYTQNYSKETKSEKEDKKFRLLSLNTCFSNGSSRNRKIWIISGSLILLIVIVTSIVVPVSLLGEAQKGMDNQSTKTTINPTTTESTSTESTTFSDSGSSTSSSESSSSTTSSEEITTSSSLTTTTSPPSNSYQLIPRHNWTDAPINPDAKTFNHPIQRFILTHTKDQTSTCLDIPNCILRIQEMHELTNNPEFNYYIGGDGNVYEGRGYLYQGDHTANKYGSDFNDIGLGIGFIGDFSNEELQEGMMKGFLEFLGDFVGFGIFDEDYRIFIQEEIIFKGDSANKLNQEIEKLDKYYKIQQKIIPRFIWDAENTTCDSVPDMSSPVNRTVFSHTLTALCDSINSCGARIKSLDQGTSCSRYNFAIGAPSGLILEGRGYSKLDIRSALFLHLGFIGNFNAEVPTTEMIDSFKNFITDSIALGKLTEDYQLNDFTHIYGGSSPVNLLNILRNCSNFVWASPGG